MSKYLQLHVIILLWGFTPVLGKLISIHSLDLVWYRLLLAGISIYLYARYKGVSLYTDRKSLLEMILIGFVIGLHWFAFYEAIKVSNVSATMAGFATITLFASLLQPLLLKKKFFWADLIYGAVIGGGLIVILNFEAGYTSGILYGILAAVTAAFFGVYNGRLIVRHDSVKITVVEFLGAFLFISAAKLVFGDQESYLVLPDFSDGVYLLLLSIVCTTVAFTWSIHILKDFSPLTVIITNNLEPIYGVVFSVFLFGESEYMTPQFYAGAGMILLSVFTYPFVQKRFNKM